jgi:hypothetical protein
MSSKPKKADYQPSEAEKASAAVAMAEQRYFKEKYDPLLQQVRDQSRSDDRQKTLRGRANADTMQTLAGGANYDAAASGRSGGDMAQAYQGQMAQANTAAKDIQNKQQLGVLGTARGQAADAQSGMAQAASMGASQALSRAAANQQVREAKTAALGQIGTSLIMQGAKNMSTKAPVMDEGVQRLDAEGNPMFTSGSFFSPVDQQGNKVTGFRDRLGASGFTNTNPFGSN